MSFRFGEIDKVHFRTGRCYRVSDQWFFQLEKIYTQGLLQVEMRWMLNCSFILSAWVQSLPMRAYLPHLNLYETSVNQFFIPVRSLPSSLFLRVYISDSKAITSSKNIFAENTDWVLCVKIYSKMTFDTTRLCLMISNLSLVRPIYRLSIAQPLTTCQ